MSWWWLLLVLLIPIAWVLLQTVVGFATPPAKSGRFYLRTQLKQAGVLQFIPDAVITELVDDAISYGEAVSKITKEGWRTEMVNRLDTMATVVGLWVKGDDTPVKDDSSIPKTLLKYGVQRGTLGRVAERPRTLP
jgi:hypothetical protein